MNKKQAGNCLTLADLLGNEMRDALWDFSFCSSCAIGYAQDNAHLFGGDCVRDNIFGEDVDDIMWGKGIKEEDHQKVTKASIRRKILKAVDDAGWEEA